MSIPQSTNTYAVATATSSTIVPFVSSHNPSSTNIVGPTGPFKVGQKWINESNNTSWTLTSFAVSNGTVAATWTQEGGSGSGSVESVTGTANQVTASPTTGNVVLSTPTTFIAPGSVTATTTLGFNAATGKILAANAGVANSSIGQVTLLSGSAGVATTAVTGSSLIFLSNAGNSGTVGVLYVSALVPGSSFTISSSAGSSDLSLVNWWIIN